MQLLKPRKCSPSGGIKRFTAIKNLSQLRWQCRRGMRELDELLLAYLVNEYSAGSDEKKDAFHELLALSDPELRAYLLGGEDIGRPAMDEILRQMRH